jgi:hypothetical protein
MLIHEEVYSMSEQSHISKLPFLRILLVVGVSLVSFALLLNLPWGEDFYYNGIAPCVISFISTITGEITSRGHRLGGWIAGGAALVVFGGTEAMYLHVNTTNRPTIFVEFTILGVTLGIIALYAWRFFTKRKTT